MLPMKQGSPDALTGPFSSSDHQHGICSDGRGAGDRSNAVGGVGDSSTRPGECGGVLESAVPPFIEADNPGTRGGTAAAAPAVLDGLGNEKERDNNDGNSGREQDALQCVPSAEEKRQLKKAAKEAAYRARLLSAFPKERLEAARKHREANPHPMLQGMMGGMGGVMGNNPNNVSAYAASSMGGGFNGCMEVNDNPFANQGFPPNRMGSAWSDRQGYYQADDAARTTAVFKRQVATMAMNEASTAFKDMEDAFSLANEVMSQYPEYNHPLVSEAIAHAKKYQSVAMFKLKVSQRASEEAANAYDSYQSMVDGVDASGFNPVQSMQGLPRPNVVTPVELIESEPINAVTTPSGRVAKRKQQQLAKTGQEWLVNWANKTMDLAEAKRLRGPKKEKRLKKEREKPFNASILPPSNGVGGDSNCDDVVVLEAERVEQEQEKERLAAEFDRRIAEGNGVGGDSNGDDVVVLEAEWVVQELEQVRLAAEFDRRIAEGNGVCGDSNGDDVVVLEAERVEQEQEQENGRKGQKKVRKTDGQLRQLYAAYDASTAGYITSLARNALAASSGLTPVQITKWFEHQRRLKKRKPSVGGGTGVGGGNISGPIGGGGVVHPNNDGAANNNAFGANRGAAAAAEAGDDFQFDRRIAEGAYGIDEEDPFPLTPHGQAWFDETCAAANTFREAAVEVAGEKRSRGESIIQRRIRDFVRRRNGEAAFLAAMDCERLENDSLPEDATVNSDWSVLKHAPHLDVILDVARDSNFETVSADYSLNVHREAGAAVLPARELALAMGINVDVNGDGREVEALWAESGLGTDCPFSPEMLSGMKAFADELEKEDLSGVDTDVGQWNYTAWFVLRFLTKEQIDWLKTYELGLWIALHSTKIGESKSLKGLFEKMSKLQSYVPFAIVKFKARLCKNGRDREQCKHCVWWTRNVNGERFFLSKDERDSVLAPLPGESDGVIIYGDTLPTQLYNRNAKDEAKGELYCSEIDLPASTLTNLSKLDGGFYGVIHGLKLGSVSDGTPSARFGHHTWSTSFGIKYFAVPCDTPFNSEKELQWRIKNTTPDLHNQGEWFKANEDLEMKVRQFFAKHGSIFHGTYDRAGIIKNMPSASINRWASEGWISESIKEARLADNTLSKGKES